MSNINPSLLENVFTVTYRYAADTSGGTAYYKPLINIDNVDSINVNTLTYSNIAFGDVFGNVFVGDQAGANGTNRSNVNGFGEQALDYSDNVRNVNAMGFSAMNQADDLSNVVGIGTYIGSNMSNVSNSVFLGDFVAGELTNTSGEIFIGTRVAENLVASGGQNIVIGNEGLNTATSVGLGNVLIGAGVVSNGLSPGSSNVVIGVGAGANMDTSSAKNVILGGGSGLNIVGGSNNILIGHDVDPSGDCNDYLKIGNLIQGSQTISYVSIMTNNTVTGGITLGNNVNIYPTGSPFALTVSGAIEASREFRSTKPTNSNIAAILKYDSGNDRAVFLAYNNSGTSTSNPPILFQQDTICGGTFNRMIIDTNGNVGINTMTPGATLNVSGTISGNTFVGNGTIPLGGIIMWSGSIASIPAGWALCDGTNGTPDLRDRFIVGSGNAYAVGANGGSTTIGASNLPKHSHTMVDPGHGHRVTLSFQTSDGGSGTGGIEYDTNAYGRTDMVTFDTSMNIVGTTVEVDKRYEQANKDAGSYTNYTMRSFFAFAGTTLSQNGLILDSNNNPVTQSAYLPPYYSLAYIMRTA